MIDVLIVWIRLIFFVNCFCLYSYKREFNAILAMMVDDSSDSSEDSSDSENDDLDLLLFENMYPSSAKRNKSRLQLEDLSEIQCVQMFRFEKHDLFRLRDALQIPGHYICSQGTKTTGMEALLLMLRRFTYPNRWCDLESLFGRSESELSLIFNKIIDDLYIQFHHLLDTLDLIWLDPEVFSQAIHGKGAPLEQCWGFIDRTPRPIARPVRNQRIMYSGHNMFGPIEGRRHDAFMLGVSGLSDKLSNIRKRNGDPYVIYGGPAYGLSYNILSPFRGAQVTNAQKQFNSAMSKVRVSVKWGFGKICQIFAYLDFKKNLKILLQPIGKYYLVASLITNCHTCLYGSQTGDFFGLVPPSLETYLLNQ